MPDRAHVPPGWPEQVRPPEVPDWERTAVGWLFDLCPPDHRAYAVLRRHPVVLARVAAEHVRAQVAGCRAGLATARSDLREDVAPEVVDAVLALYEREGRRLSATARAVELVLQALRGHRFVPRL